MKTSDRELNSLRQRKITIENQIDSLKFSKKQNLSSFRTIGRRNNLRDKRREKNEKAQKIRMASNANGENVILGDKWNLKDVARNVRRSVIMSLDSQTNEIRKRRKKIFENTTLSNSIESPNLRRNSSVKDFVDNNEVLGPVGKKMLENSFNRKRRSLYLSSDRNLISSKLPSTRSILSLRSSNGSQEIASSIPLSLNLRDSNDFVAIDWLPSLDENDMKTEFGLGIDHQKQYIESNFLYHEGFLYHKYCSYCHRQPFASSLKMLSMQSFSSMSGNQDNGSMHFKSKPKIFFKTWKEAQVFLNDDHFISACLEIEPLCAVSCDRTKAFELPITPKSRNVKDLSFSEMMLCLPIKSPIGLKDKYRLYAGQLDSSISSFVKVAKKSVKSASLPGGSLTIRPISALHLSGTNNKLYVKLSFGAISLMTKAVDNNVCPTWGRVDARLGSNKNTSDNSLSKNDLELYIDAFGTNGYLQLAGKLNGLISAK